MQTDWFSLDGSASCSAVSSVDDDLNHKLERL